MAWQNTDGLYVKFGKEEAALSRGGEISNSSKHELQFVVDWTDLLSATYSLLGSVSTLTGSGASLGVSVPEGARIEAIETVVLTAFTSSGTIGSSTLGMGLKKLSDRSTELDHDGFTTASFVGGVLDAVGERTYVVPGVTGAGALIGTTISENGLICVANTAHASHPYTAGKLLVRLFYTLPVVSS